VLQSSAHLEDNTVPAQAVLAVRNAEEAANRAAMAFWSWSHKPAHERGALLGELAEALQAGRNDLVDLAAEEVGAAPQWTDFNIEIAQAILRQASDLIPHLREQRVDHGEDRTSVVQRHPVGVVLGFAPWNAPITLAARAIAAPLACGNTVVLKASEHCPRTQSRVVELFTEAGLPENVVTVVTNAADDSLEVARALIRHPVVRRINFTGSTRVGRIIAVEAAQVLKRCLLELSGKAPLIILDDANLDTAAAAAMTGAFFNQGQVCMSTERIVVLDAIADEFVARLVEKSRTLRAADPREKQASLGRLISPQAVQRVQALVEDAVDRGADRLIGGEADGEVMQPVILDNVTPGMRIFHEESFGPVASIIRVPDEEAAVSIANDTEFGLASAIFGADVTRCMAIADRLETGICQINGPSVFDDPTMPFGGMKASGYGRFGGLSALDEFTEARWLSQHHGLGGDQIEQMLNLGRKRHDDET
jgi:acyl-CoA reductase-like NAD-dependent aldehyde dehydrogenase